MIVGRLTRTRRPSVGARIMLVGVVGALCAPSPTASANCPWATGGQRWLSRLLVTSGRHHGEADAIRVVVSPPACSGARWPACRRTLPASWPDLNVGRHGAGGVEPARRRPLVEPAWHVAVAPSGRSVVGYVTADFRRTGSCRGWRRASRGGAFAVSQSTWFSATRQGCSGAICSSRAVVGLERCSTRASPLRSSSPATSPRDPPAPRRMPTWRSVAARRR